jgi:hypothetical protein
VRTSRCPASRAAGGHVQRASGQLPDPLYEIDGDDDDDVRHPCRVEPADPLGHPITDGLAIDQRVGLLTPNSDWASFNGYSGRSALVEQAGGLYVQAVEGTSADQLRQLGADLAAHDRLPAPLQLDGWERALDALLAREGLVVIDEVSYLVASDASLASRLQRQLDARRSGPAVRLLLCGSALPVMRGLLVGSAPLLFKARHLLDEPVVRDRALYLSVLAALGEGATTSSQLASRLRRR